MAKTVKTRSKREDILASAKTALQEELNYEGIADAIVEGELCAIAQRRGHPIVLVYVPERLGPIAPETQELAIQLGAIVDGGPADYVWATATGRLGDGFIYSWLPDKECQVSSIPPASEIPKSSPAAARIRPAADPVRFKELQHEFDELH